MASKVFYPPEEAQMRVNAPLLPFKKASPIAVWGFYSIMKQDLENSKSLVTGNTNENGNEKCQGARLAID